MGRFCIFEASTNLIDSNRFTYLDSALKVALGYTASFKAKKFIVDMSIDNQVSILSLDSGLYYRVQQATPKIEAPKRAVGRPKNPFSETKLNELCKVYVRNNWVRPMRVNAYHIEAARRVAATAFEKIQAEAKSKKSK